MSRSLFRVCLLIGGLALIAFAAPSARAQSPCGCGYSYGWGSSGYDWRASARIIPYFAEHPPVYYSYPVARPYGYSPYALPPGVLPAELQVAPPKPEEIVNPYYVPKSEEPDVQPAREAAPQTASTGDRTA
jgi:hypothetical protein